MLLRATSMLFQAIASSAHRFQPSRSLIFSPFCIPEAAHHHHQVAYIIYLVHFRIKFHWQPAFANKLID